MFRTLFLNTFSPSASVKWDISRIYKDTALSHGHPSSDGNSILSFASQNTLTKTSVQCFFRTYEAANDTFMLTCNHRNPSRPVSRSHTFINSRYTTICKSQVGVTIRVKDKNVVYWMCLKIVLKMCLDDFYMYYLMRTLFFI